MTIRRPIVRFLIRLVLRFELGLISYILFLLYKYKNLPLYYTYISLGTWIFLSLFIPYMLSRLIRMGKDEDRENLLNKNPYSSSNSDIFNDLI